MGGKTPTQQEGTKDVSLKQLINNNKKGIHSPSDPQEALLHGFPMVLVSSLILGAHGYFLYFLFDVSHDIHANYVDYVALWIPIFFASLILEAIYSEYYSLNIVRLNDTVGSVSLGTFMTITKSLWNHYLSLAPYIYIYNNFRLTNYFSNDPNSFWMMFFIVEFIYYWVHRTGHTFHTGWAMHGVHHSSEEYNLSTALRQSSLHGLISNLYHVPAALFFHPTYFYLNLQFNLLYQFWIHTSAIPKLGPLEWVLNTPSQHRVHHGRNSYCIDKNYGGTLCIFDRLFGTFEEERDDEAVVFGVTHGLESFDPIWPNWDLWQPMILNHDAKNLKDYLCRFYYGPGWVPNTYHPVENYDVPPITRETQQKFNPILPPGLHRYAFFNFCLLLSFYAVVLSVKRTDNNFLADNYDIFLFFCLYCLCSFALVLNRSKWAVLAETGRWLLTLLLVVWYVQEENKEGKGEDWFLWGGVGGCVAMWGWLIAYRRAFAVPLAEFEVGKDLPEKEKVQ